jgi:hypothetical protein
MFALKAEAEKKVARLAVSRICRCGKYALVLALWLGQTR